MLENKICKTFDQFSKEEFDRLYNNVSDRVGKLFLLSKPNGSYICKQSLMKFVQFKDKETGKIGFASDYSLAEVQNANNIFLEVSSYINWEYSCNDNSASVISFRVVQYDDDMETSLQVLDERWWKCATKFVRNNIDDVLLMLNTLINRGEYDVKA